MSGSRSLCDSQKVSEGAVTDSENRGRPLLEVTCGAVAEAGAADAVVLRRSLTPTTTIPGRRPSASRESKHTPLEEVGTADHSAGGRETRRDSLRPIRHGHRFAHLAAQSVGRQFLGG
jgi:hypothetical protein